ncbi:MAG: YidC/Oxa1 family insertase periplasmic-domain containing protein [Phycisphaerae bacterium]|nr:YidC/Oxa1 family insertase periplasmic-domain containing protein [Phycisphaerae bacterium]
MDLRRLGAMVVVLVVGVVFLMLYANSQHRQRQTAQTPAKSAPATAPVPAAAPAAAPARAAAATPRHAPAEGTDKWFGTRAEPQIIALGSADDPNGYCLQLQLAAEGAGVYTAKLTGYFWAVQETRLFEKDPQAYKRALAENPQEYQGHYSVLNPVGPEDAQVLSLATQRLTVQLQGDQPAELVLEDLDRKPWQLLQLTEDTAQFAYVLCRGPNWDAAQANPILRLVKTYSLRKSDYTVYVSLRVENLSGRTLRVSLDQRGPTGLPEDGDRTGSRRQALYGQYGGPDRAIKVIRHQAKGLGKLAYGQRLPAGVSHQSPSTLWIGSANRYFGAMMYLVPTEPDKLAAVGWRAPFYIDVARESGGSKTYAPGVTIPDLLLPPDQPAKEVHLEVFIGPKKRALFADSRAPGYRQAYERLNYLGAIDIESYCCIQLPLTLGMIRPLTLGMMWLLGALTVVTLGNYGVAIILLVFLVRLVLHPITKKSQVSMVRLQKLAPQVAKLKDKYGKDKAAYNREIMALYKQHGASPLWGCLPMLLQIPIWVALYTALSVAVELRHAGFLPVWITDLSAPDALWTWPERYSLPFVGNTFNFLPILMTVAMFFQSKVMSSMSQTTATPDQARQQKMMQYMMVPMMLLFFYAAPSGLTLYIMASTFAGLAEQKVIRKHIQDREAAAAAAEATVPLPGKTFRGQRPRKPRGPFWTKRG